MEKSRKPFSSFLLLMLLFASMLSFVLNIQPVKSDYVWTETIYIHADGSITPIGAPITTVELVTYVLTDNIVDADPSDWASAIIVERDNIVLDGAGYTLLGTQTSFSNGISLSGRSNVTIKNITNKHFYTGVRLTGSYNNTVSGNNIKTNNGYGISLYGGFNNTISGNNVTNNRIGIEHWYSSHDNISGNNITSNDMDGISSCSANCSNISGNQLSFNKDHAVLLLFSSNNTITDNIISNNERGGIWFTVNSSYNIISKNSVFNNGWDGCAGIGGGYDSKHNIIKENEIWNCWGGIHLDHANYTATIIGNSILSCEFGITFFNYCRNNTIYHNNFINNTQQVKWWYSPSYANFWDDGYPSGGNYWSDYTSVDLYGGYNQDEAGGDGMGDTPYIIDENNTDHYPLMNPWPSGWKLDFAGTTKHPIVDFAVYNGSLYAAADSKLYVYDGSSWDVIDAPTFVTSLETVNVTNRQPAPIDWSHTYGGTDMDYAYDLIQTSDGGYALTGFTWSYGAGIYDFWLVKTDANGILEWNQTYGGTGEDIAYALVQTTDGGYAVVGHTASFAAGLSDVWLVKTDADGVMQWNKTIGGANSEKAYDLVQTEDGGFALTGYTFSYGSDIGSHSDAWLVKTNAEGNVLWNQTYGGYGGHDSVHALIQTTDGGYALAGQRLSIFPGGFWIIKTDVAGNEQWNKTYGGTVYNQEWANGILQTIDGGYAVIGCTRSFGAGNGDFWLVKTDANGDMQWNKTYGGAFEDVGYDLLQASEGGFVLTGYTYSLGAGHDFWIIKTDADGAAQWNQTYGGPSDEFAHASVQAADEGYVIAGYTYSYGAGSYDFWLVRTEPYDDSKERLVVGGQGGLYCYDGASLELIFSVPTYIKMLRICNGTLYAGTMLDNPPTLYYCNGSVGNSANWHVDTGFSAILSFSGAFGSIDSLTVYNNALYVSSGGTVYCYNGTDWSIAKSYNDVYAFLDMQVYGGKLHLATRDHAWRKPVYQGGSGFNGRIIEYDGNNWTTVFDHDYWIFSLSVYDSKLYAGTANRIFTYDGAAWEISFNATGGAYYVMCFENYDGKIYAGMGNGYIFVDPAPVKTKLEVAIMPEFPSLTILTVFMVLIILATTFTKKRHKTKHKTSIYSKP